MKIDSRITHLAENLIHYSLALKPGEVVYIDLIGKDTRPLGQELIRMATEQGSIPYWNDFDDELAMPFFRNASEKQNQAFAQFHKQIMERVDAYIGIRAPSNPYDQGNLSTERKNFRQAHYWNDVHIKTRLAKRWCVLRYPNAAMSVLAKKNQEEFEAFYFNVCNLDYSRMSRAMDPLVDLMSRTDQVRIVSPGTDITFSIKGIPVVKCDGKVNIPDGEVFTAPVRESMNGVIRYNTTSFYQGSLFRDLTLEVKNGKIVRFDSPDHMTELQQIFDTDPGARYFGEFAIGLNPYILDPMNDTLFDEKICGSIHLTPGNSYGEADNGNKSAIHWDWVLIQRPEYGGGELYFDGKLIRKDGRFVIPALADLDSKFD